jgi:hypothetical protein
MIADRPPSDQRGSAAGEASDPVVARYRAFFALLDWSQVPERETERPWPGPVPHPRAAYIKALLVKVCEGKAYVTELRRFLVEHPALVREVGFRPVVDATQPWGFDVERTVPSERWLRHQQQHLEEAALEGLLRGTVRALQDEIPGLGITVAFDVKHIYAWVQENNPKAYVSDRFNAARQPRGDWGCRLGVKRRTNQEAPAGRATGHRDRHRDRHRDSHKEYLWGYGTGLASATDPTYGDVVLAEFTQPFHENDITYYHPLYRQTVVNLGFPPTNVTLDAAFDAWHVYQTCADTGGIAAIPLNRRGQPPPDRDAQGLPRCARGLSMVPFAQFTHEDGYRAQRCGCPLLLPRPTGHFCPHERFATGRGCVKTINLEPGGQMRARLDRRSAAFQALYRQRTSAERINSQATALGIERPKVRTRPAVHHLNTLTYIVINARALQRVRATNARLAS